MFEEAADLSPGEIKAYRKFLRWRAQDVIRVNELFHVALKMIILTTNKILGEDYVVHPYFSLETPEAWINPQSFEAYMSIMHGPFEDYRGRRRDSTPFSSCAPSRAPSSRARSRASSRVSFLPSSRASSPASFASSDAMSHPSSAMSIHSFTDVPKLDPGFPDSDILPFVPAHIRETKALDGLHPKESMKSRGRGKGKANIGTISITRQQKVDEIIDTSTVESTWTVPCTPIAIRVDVSQCMEKLTLPDGRILSLDAFIRAENSLVHRPEIMLTELLFIDRSMSEPDAHFNPELTFQYSTLDFFTDNGSIDVGMLGTTNSMDYPIDGAPNFDSTPVDSLTDFLANSCRTTYGFGASDSDGEAFNTLGTTYDLPLLPPAPASLELNTMEGKASRKQKAKEPEVDERHIIPGGRATRSRIKTPKTRAEL
ncbi:hypothetical protein K438DRAFT_1764985 [Mycena galopus ATCC 62051]|nr:hypothetical protein K438DRAFT_1764985 [Mycena galopus ATCC 62051]